jgi:hypothetical protein
VPNENDIFVKMHVKFCLCAQWILCYNGENLQVYLTSKMGFEGTALTAVSLRKNLGGDPEPVK